MGWSAFLLAYLLGGVTLLPLVIISVLAHAYLTFPHRDDLAPKQDDPADDIVQPGDSLEALKEAQKLLREESKRTANRQDPEVAAGYFAVCREYTPMGVNARPIERTTPMGSTTVAAPSPSVYQTMYRSIFDRKQTPGPLEGNRGASQRPKKAGNVFYVVLRHGHLMLFDDDEQLEVRHVISLAHHDISIYSGGDKTPEGELYIKRNAICLSRKTGGVEMAPDTRVSKPFYLFSENCSAKEDFYFSLMRNQAQNFGSEGKTPTPVQFDVKNIISLVQKLHSSEEHLQTRWLNAMIGRVFLGVYQTKDLEHFIRAKLTKKISRVKRPSFLSGISIQKIVTGESAPYITNPRLKDLTVEGECGVEADVRYTGNFRIEVAATARIDLGTRFKAREVNLVLAVVLKKLEGHILFKIKAPPSNRVWFSFQQMPKMEMSLEPIISSRQITYTLILRQIENRIKEVFAETLVLPFWDDMPFFRTEHKKWRGGIWEGDDAVEPTPDLEAAMAQLGNVDEVDRYEETGSGLNSPEFPPVEKSHSITALDHTVPTGLFGRKINGKLTNLSKAGSSSTSGVDVMGEVSPKPRPIRSNSFVNPPAPTTGTDSTNADMFKPSASPPNESPAVEAMASLTARSHGATPSYTPVGSPHKSSTMSSRASGHSTGSSREATDSEKDKEQTPKTQQRRGTTSSAGSNSRYSDKDHGDAASNISNKSSLRSQTGSLTRNFFLRRDTNQSTASASTAASDGSAGKRTTLAAVSNAAASAKRWGFNALQRHHDDAPPSPRTEGTPTHPPSTASSTKSSTLDLSKPIGGGRPLPPPGVPLPMPDRKTKIMPAPTSRRKVPPPPLPDRTSTASASASARSPDDRLERRPVPAPPLPKRRQQRMSQVDGDGDGLLRIAAPVVDSSEPGSADEAEAEAEGEGAYVAPWVEDAADEEGVVGASSASPVETPPPHLTPPKQQPHEEEQEEEEEEELPFGPAEHEDDDDEAFSAWMDEEQHGGVGDRVDHDLSPLTEPGAAVTGEGMAQ